MPLRQEQKAEPVDSLPHSLLPGTGSSTLFRIAIFGDRAVDVVPLAGQRWTIGRAEDNDICLRDPTVSRRHLVLERQFDDFFVRDVGSSNPMLLDGRPIREGLFRPGQTLLVGTTRLTLEARSPSVRVVMDRTQTFVQSREVLDPEAIAETTPAFQEALVATGVLDRLSRPDLDLESQSEIAQHLLELALDLSHRQRGAIGRLLEDGMEPLASIDRGPTPQALHLPEQLVREARSLMQPHIVVAMEGASQVDRLLIPMGAGPSMLLVLDEPRQGAPSGQALLRFARALGALILTRFQESSARLQLREEVARLRFQGSAAHNAVLACGRLHDTRQQLRRVANQDVPVLLVGEAGTEHEDLARYLHSESLRGRGPLVSFHPAFVPAAAIDGELFGSGPEHPGAVQRAHGGTLYIDQIEHLPLATQERLFVTLQSRRLLLGGMTLPVDIRLVAATTGPLSNAAAPPHPPLVDLLDRCTIAIPPLRSDARDILVLAEVFLSQLGPGPTGAPRLLSERAKRVLTDCRWPGNVRQLRIVLEAAAARAGLQPIAPRHLEPELAPLVESNNGEVLASLESVERQHIRDVLLRVGSNRARAAQVLGIAASTLYEKIKKYAIDA